MSNEHELGMQQVDLEIEAEGFDLDGQKQEMHELDEGIWVDIDGAKGQPLNYRDENGVVRRVQIRVAPLNSQKYRAEEAKLRKRKIDRQFTGEKIYNDQIEKAAAVTLDWRGFRNGSTPIRCDTENAKAIYLQYAYVLEKVTEAINEPDRFSSKGSQQ